MRIHHALSRRALLTAAAALAASPALAQFNIPMGSGSVDVGKLFSGAKSLFDGFSLGEADEIKMGQAYYGGFVDRSGGPYRNRNAQAALASFALRILDTVSMRIGRSRRRLRKVAPCC